jgi:hypothetical protein
MRQVSTFAIPSPALPVSGSVGMISARNYPGFTREGTPLRKISLANVEFLKPHLQIYPIKKCSGSFI